MSQGLVLTFAFVIFMVSAASLCMWYLIFQGLSTQSFLQQANLSFCIEGKLAMRSSLNVPQDLERMLQQARARDLRAKMSFSFHSSLCQFLFLLSCFYPNTPVVLLTSPCFLSFSSQKTHFPRSLEVMKKMEQLSFIDQQHIPRTSNNIRVQGYRIKTMSRGQGVQCPVRYALRRRSFVIQHVSKELACFSQ